ncbi:MAG: hypothetical protein OQK77_03365 [Psychromonas sp.]|nr:hypothetical protein [Psychromonas sp.]
MLMNTSFSNIIKFTALSLGVIGLSVLSVGQSFAGTIDKNNKGRLISSDSGKKGRHKADPGKKDLKITLTTAPEIILTTAPESEGAPLFIRQSDPEQNITGFEFCCGGYQTYLNYGFTDLEGDFKKLDGGWWGADVANHLGVRVFSSFGDGALADGTPVGWIGFEATGSMKSPIFTINNNYINFLIGGGDNGYDEANTTAVVLIVEDEVVRQAAGKNNEFSVSWETWDVRKFKGKTAQIQFIDNHSNDKSDNALPYLIVDEIRGADKAAVVPSDASELSRIVQYTTEPAIDGVSAFTRASNPDLNIAGFEFCCGQFNTYPDNDFRASGDLDKLNGGMYAANIIGHIGERVFSSRGDGFSADGTNLGWIGDSATGSVVTPPFVIEQEYINFLIGGGSNVYTSNNATAMVLRVDGKIVRHATGNGLDSQLDWKTWDVKSLIGKTAVIEIIDQHDATEVDGSLPFILVDEIRQANLAANDPIENSIVNSATGHDQNLQMAMADPNPIYIDGTYYIYYLLNSSFHDWYLAKTDDLITSSFPLQALPASGNITEQDQWVGSGSVIIDNSGEAHLFYTAHNSESSIVEAIMHATANDKTLVKWSPQTADTFTGNAGYSDFDFRDPKVFWNAETSNYWMLITSRYDNKAAIGLYTSTDLSNWTAQAPLYMEDSSLNLEVADYVTLNNTPYLLYSDQHEDSHQVKFLSKVEQSWVRSENNALDGEYFYAGRTAGSEDEQLLFGWVPHKNTRVNVGHRDFGGDLMIHQLSQNVDGKLTVSLPERVKESLMVPAAIEQVATSGSVSGEGNISLANDASFDMLGLETKNRFSFTVTSDVDDAVFGIQFKSEDAEVATARLEIDARQDFAQFYFGDTAPVRITSTPAQEGFPLFIRGEAPEQNIAGFEFCCGQYDTYQEHGFVNVTGDLIKLDGGMWGGDVEGNFGDRVLSTFSDGFAEDGTALGWIGYGAVGTIDSPNFEITENYINFLIGGGNNPYDNINATAMVLIVDGEVVRDATGNNEPRNAANKFPLHWMTWDVSDLKGKTAFIRFIDQHPDDGSDDVEPYLLVDEIRAASLPAVIDNEAVVAEANVSVPVDTSAGVSIDLLLDPQAEVGAVYINNNRALSFRLYGLSERKVGIYSKDNAVTVNSLNRFSH